MVLNFKLHLLFAWNLRTSFKLKQNKNPKHHLQTKGVHSNTVFQQKSKSFLYDNRFSSVYHLSSFYKKKVVIILLRRSWVKNLRVAYQIQLL